MQLLCAQASEKVLDMKKVDKIEWCTMFNNFQSLLELPRENFL